MVDFISEVQEELRKDDYNRWLKKYGPYALAGIVAVIAGAGFMEWNKAQHSKKARMTSASYISASDLATSGDVDAAMKSFMAISEMAPSGYAGLALMRTAELELDKGNTAKAVSLLDQAAQTFETSRHAQLAQIKAAYILSDKGEYADVATRAAPLAEKEQPYEYLARELLGFAYKEMGDNSAARQQFSYLNTIPGVPSSIQQRAKQYLDLMTVASIGSEDIPEATPVNPEIPAEEAVTPEPTETTDEP